MLARDHSATASERPRECACGIAETYIGLTFINVDYGFDRLGHRYRRLQRDVSIACYNCDHIRSNRYPDRYMFIEVSLVLGSLGYATNENLTLDPR